MKTHGTLLGGFLLFVGCAPEPRFEGRPLSYWMDELKHPKNQSRLNVATAMEKFGPEAKDAVPDLIELLKHKDPLTRWAAAIALSGMEEYGKPAIPALRELATKDPNHSVNEAAGRAIEQLERVQ